MNGESRSESGCPHEEGERIIGMNGFDNKSNMNSNKDSNSEVVSRSGKDSTGSDGSSDKFGADSDDDGLSDYEKLRLERIRRNQEYLSRLGLEEEKVKWNPQKRKRKTKDQITNDGQRTQQRKLSLRAKKEQVRYSDVSISEIFGRKPRSSETSSNKPRVERVAQHRMERYIYREFQRIQAERNGAQKQIEQLIKRTEKETAFWEKLLQQKEKRDVLLQKRQMQAQDERTIYGGLNVRQLLRQIDERWLELVQIGIDYDREVEEMRRNWRKEAQKQQKQEEVKRVLMAEIYPILLQNSFNIFDEILFERFVGFNGPPQRRSSRYSVSTTDSARNFPEVRSHALPECLTNKLLGGYVSGDDCNIFNNARGWISPQYANIIDRSWPDRSDIFVPQAGDLVLYYPFGHQLFLRQYPDTMGEKSPSRQPLWKVAATQNKETDSRWWSDSWLDSVKDNQAVYPLLCRVTATHFEFPPDDPYFLSNRSDGRAVWKKKGMVSGARNHQNTSVRLVIGLRPLTPILPEALPVPPCFSVVWFPSDKAKPFVVPFQSTYTIFQSLSLGKIEASNEVKFTVHNFRTLNKKSVRLDGYLTALAGISQNEALNDNFEQEMQKLPPQYRIATHEIRSIVDLFQTRIAMNSPSNEPTHELSNQEVTVFFIIRSTMPLWEGITVVPKSNKRTTMNLSVWDLHFEDGSEADVLKGSSQNVIELVINQTVRDYAESDLFVEAVTDNDAPSYSCAVPISMSTSKVLNRMRLGHYRSINAILNDFNAILGNCLLYNSPDAPIVSKARTFVSSLHSNIQDALVQCETIHKHLSSNVMQGTLHRVKPARTLYTKPTTTLPYKGALECKWLNSKIIWIPQAGDIVFYSKLRHEKFLDYHSCNLTTIQCYPITDLNYKGDEIEAEVLWTKPCFPQQRRKHTDRTFQQDSPVIEVGLQVKVSPDVVTVIYWRPCTLSDKEPSNCECGCTESFLRMARGTPQSMLTNSDLDNLSRSFAALKQRCRQQTSPLIVDTRNTVKERRIRNTNSQTGMDESCVLALHGYLHDSSLLCQQGEGSLLVYPFPELCLDLVEKRLQSGFYRSQRSLVVDIMESYVNIVCTTLSRLNKVERGHICLRKIALAFAQSHRVSEEEKRLMDDLVPIRELHAAALVSTISNCLAKDTTLDCFEPDPDRESARRALGALLSALGQDPAESLSSFPSVKKAKVRVQCGGKTVTYCKEVRSFQMCLAEYAGKTTRVKILLKGSLFTYECDLEEVDSDEHWQSSAAIAESKSIETNHIIYSKQELAKYTDAARFFFGRPDKLNPCARCQVKCRPFFECRVTKRHSNIDFDWKHTLARFNGMTGLLAFLQPHKQDTLIASQDDEATEIISGNEAKERFLVEDCFEKCKELLQQAKSFENHVQHICTLPIRLSKKFVQESFPIDSSDGRYIYCIICGISGDLFCCDTCPNVFHSKCLGLENVPAGEWHCEECQCKEANDCNQSPFGRSDLDLSQLNRFDTELASLRNIRADRIKRHVPDKSEGDERQEVQQKTACMEVKGQSEKAVQQRGRRRETKSNDSTLENATEPHLPRRSGRHQAAKKMADFERLSLADLSHELPQKATRGSGTLKRIRPTLDSATPMQANKRRHVSGEIPPNQSRQQQFLGNMTKPTRTTGNTKLVTETNQRRLPQLNRTIGPAATKKKVASQLNNEEKEYQPQKFVQNLQIEDSISAQEKSTPLSKRHSARLSKSKSQH